MQKPSRYLQKLRPLPPSGPDSRQVVRRRMFKEEFFQLSKTSADPRRARRNIARVLAKKAWGAK